MSRRYSILQKGQQVINSLSADVSRLKEKPIAKANTDATDSRDKELEALKLEKQKQTESSQQMINELTANVNQLKLQLKAKANTDTTDSRSEKLNEITELRAELEKEKSGHLKAKKKVEDLETACHDAFVKLESKDKLIKQLEANHKELVTRKENTINELRREATKVDVVGGNTNEELQKLRDENDHLKSRISKMVGAQLLDGNPNIADLSDDNRATRLAERFSELYDNDWMDAFEEKEVEHGEEGTVKYLHDLLMDVHDYCQKMSADHASNLVSSLLSMPNHGSKAENISMASSKSKQLKDIRKTFATDITDTVAKCYIEDKKPAIAGRPGTESYIRKCVQLCWLMTVQDPPVTIDRTASHGSAKFNSDNFKAYTKTGTRLDYVVWPPLLLHENGPLLCKGVAQAK